MTWLSAHLHHHEDPAAVIAAVVAPTAAELEPDIDWFFVRYWDGGPHVRLRIRAGDTDTAAQLRERISSRFADLVARHPSRRTIDARAYAEVVATLLATDRVRAQPTPARDNSVSWPDYEPETDRYGGPLALAAVQTFFAASSRDALDTLADRRDPATVALWCAAVGLCAVAGSSWAAEFGRHCTRHWPAHRPVAGWEDAVQAAWARHGPAVRAVVGDAVAVTAGQPSGEDTDSWLVACRALQHRLRTLEETDLIATVLPGVAAQAQVPHFDRGLITWFALHMHHNRLGIHLDREAMMIELLCRALSEETDPT